MIRLSIQVGDRTVPAQGIPGGINQFTVGTPTGLYQRIYQHPKLQQHYRLSIAPSLPETIEHDLVSGAALTSVAPTLQILLAQFWATAKAIDPDAPTFSRALYHRLKEEGLWLNDFLDQQLSKLPTAFLESGLTLYVLHFHITELQTFNMSFTGICF